MQGCHSTLGIAMWAGERWRQDFDGLVDVVYYLHYGLRPRFGNTYEEELYRKLKSLTRHNNFSLCREDIAQQLALVWTQGLANGSKGKGTRSYILRLSVFGLRDWYRKELRAMDKGESEYTERTGRQIGLKWLFYGEDLTPYERYLIFLRYTQELNILEMSELLKKERHKVSEMLTRAIEKLRRKYVTETESSRYSSG